MKATAPVSAVAPAVSRAPRAGAPAPTAGAVGGGHAAEGGRGSWAGLLDAASEKEGAAALLSGSEAQTAALGHPGMPASATPPNPARPSTDGVATGDHLWSDHALDDHALGDSGPTPPWMQVQPPVADLGHPGARPPTLGAGRTGSEASASSGPPLTVPQASAGTDDLTSLFAAFSRPEAVGAAQQGRGARLGGPGLSVPLGVRNIGGAQRAAPPPKPVAPVVDLPADGLNGRAARPVDLMGPAPRVAATFDGVPWLGLEPTASPDASQTTAPGANPGRAGLRATVAATTPQRFALLSEQVSAEASERAAALTRSAPEAEPVRRTAPPRSLPTPRAAIDGGADRPPAADLAASPRELPAGEAERARSASLPRPAHPSARPATLAPSAMAATTVASEAAASTPGGNPALPSTSTVTRVHTLQAATVVDARFTDGQLPQHIGAPDLTRVELEVDEGDHALKVTLAREADGLAVEVRGPREVVAELRALRPEVDAALADEGFDLTAYDADEDPDAGARDSNDEDDPAAGDDLPNPTAETSAGGAPRGRAGLLDRQA